MGAGDLNLSLSPTQWQFVATDAHIAHLVGPMGEGKTHAAIAGYIYHAKRCGINLRAALIRDTHQNIKTSTVASIREILGDWVTFRDNYKKMFIKTRPSVEVDLFGIDDEASISKLQGPEYGLIHLEEPAPIHEKANAGLPKAVFDLALARCGRQKGSRPRLQITQNPGDGDHWSTELMEDPEEMIFRIINADGVEEDVIVHKRTFHIPPGENRHLTPLQRAMNMAAFKGDPGKWARYVEGKVATVQLGKAVTPEYGPDFHFSQKILPVYPQLEGYRGWDGYQHPSCIVAQYNPAGQLVIHDVLIEENMGVEELIDRRLQPLLLTPKYKDKIKTWRDIGDPSMKIPDQSTVTMTAAKKIEKMLKTRFEAGPTRWPNRIEPVKAALKRTVNEGRPAVVVSASAVVLHRALRGGWHYKTDNNGRRLGDLPVKDMHSHPADAFAYLLAILMPYNARQEYQRHKEKAAAMKRAMSYGQPAHYRPAPALNYGYGGRI